MSSKSNIVLISGGNDGIGFGAAKRLTSENPDYHVVIGSRTASKGEAAAAKLSSDGLSVSSVQLDINDDASIAAAASHIESSYGRLDVLINNAAVFLDNVDSTLSTRELYNKTFETNITGTACLTEAFLPLLRKSSLPRIVFVSSSLASFAYTVDQLLPWSKGQAKGYQTSKAGMTMLALSYAKQLEEDGFKVNAVCPGLVSTKMNGYHDGAATPEDGARRIVGLATLGKDGETGTYSNTNGTIPW